jgi:DNA-binding CsgD family transcriptional regulator
MFNPARSELLERDVELAEISAAFADAAAGDGRLLVVRAAAGMGKSRLLAAAGKAALARGFLGLRARGSELERDFSLGLVRQLFDPLVRSLPPSHRERALSGAAAVAGPLLGLSDAATPVAPPPSDAGLHGLYSLLANISDRQPLVLLVDDADWADEATLAFLRFLVPRLHDVSVALLIALRSGARTESSRALEAIVADPAATRLTLAPLSQLAVRSIVRERLGLRATSEFVATCRELTGGNPFYLRELCLSLGAAGLEPTVANIARASEMGLETISRAVLLRAGRASPEAASLARALAVLGDCSEPRLVGALAGIGVGEAAVAADALTRADVLADERPLRFVHPIVRSAIAGDLTAAERASAHGRAARLLAADGAPPERVAGHLLASERLGDRWATEQLRAAARVAVGRGAPAIAARYLTRALEEPAGVVRPEVLRELGVAELSAGDRAALGHLERAHAEALDARGRAGAARDLARAAVSAGDPEGALAALRAALEEAGADHPELALTLSAELSGVALLLPRRAASVMQRLLRAAETSGTSAPERLLLANLAHWLAASGSSGQRCAELAARALGDGRLMTETRAESPSFYHAVFVLIAAERFAEARDCLDGGLEEARRGGSIVAFAVVSTMRSLLEYRLGRLGEAEAEARGALDATRQEGWPPLPLGVAFLVDALVERGRFPEAQRVFDESEFGPEFAEGVLSAPLLAARGRLRIASGDLVGGVEDLLEWGRRAALGGNMGTAGTPTFRTYAAPALAALGERAKARRLIAEELELARAWGARRALGMALHGAALVQPRERGNVLLAQAVELLRQSEARLEHARALIELGAAWRRAGRVSDARVPLREGMDLAQRCGAEPLASRAKDEIAASGVRRRTRTLLSGVEALTPSERRIAGMAAAGRTNRQIAQALFVTRKTVEMHLRNAYRKLDVRSRSELPAALATEVQSAEPALRR